MPSILVRTFASPYVSGNTIDKGVSKAKQLWRLQIASTLDLLGESVDSKEMVEYNINTYMELANKLSGHHEYASISVKPTALGIHESYEYCLSSIRRIVEVAEQNRIPVTIDMEDHPYTDDTLKMYKELLKEYPTLGTVLQSRLYRTDKDIEELNGIKTRIRICIGIYNEPTDIALQNKPEMKRKLVEQAATLMQDGHYVEFATHDKQAINDILEIAVKNNWDASNLEFQQLLGVPMRQTQNKIKDAGFMNRLYVPFATDWKYATPYLKRRLKNNPKMAYYVITQMVAKLFGRR